MGFRTQRHVLPASRSQVVPASTIVTVTDGPSSAFMPNDDGPFTCRLLNDSVDVVLQVVGGGIYPLAIDSIPVGNLRSGVLLFDK